MGNIKAKYLLKLLLLFPLGTTIPIGAQNQLSEYSFHVNEKPFQLNIYKNGSEYPLFQMLNSITVQHFRDSKVFERKPYLVWLDGREDQKKKVTTAVFIDEKENWKNYYLLNDLRDTLFSFQCRLEKNQFKFILTEINPPKESDLVHSRISVPFSSNKEDSYLGMGMRFNRTNHYGTIVSNWCREVGVNIPVISENGSPEGQDITYYPVPFYLNLKGYGFLLNSFHFSEFDFAKTNSKELRITNYSNTFDATLFLAKDPFEIISNYQKSTGNYKKPNPWVFGVWAAAANDWQSGETGQNVNEKVLKISRENQIPLSAIMAEDWYWNKDIFHPLDSWTLNEKQYPQFTELINTQHKSGVKHISYFLPYLSTNLLFKKSPLFEEAKTKGFFTKTTNGKPYVFQFAVWKNTQFDWTNPATAPWFWNTFYKKLADYGVDGWMNDFGEYTPYNSKSFNGEYGLTMHNRYPLLWAKNADNFWKTSFPEKDFVIFSRSGYTGQQANVAFHFTGDRNANYDPLSGLGGQIIGMTSAGISAHPNTSIDIGAYNCEDTKPMDKLLMFRWIEMGALVPVMRLHRGLPLCDHWRFDEDEETLMQWKKYATLHAKLFPYIYTLAQHAEDWGWPMVRSLSLKYSHDNEAMKQDYEFSLGDRILSAPVIKEQEEGARNDISRGRTSWSVYLPEGNWYHYWTNKKYAGMQYYDVPAAPGFLPMFVQEGKIIPTYNKEADTFVKNVEDPSIKDFEFVDDSIEILFYGYGEDHYTLWDGTTIHCTRNAGNDGACSVENGHGRNYSYTFID